MKKKLTKQEIEFLDKIRLELDKHIEKCLKQIFDAKDKKTKLDGEFGTGYLYKGLMMRLYFWIDGYVDCIYDSARMAGFHSNTLYDKLDELHEEYVNNLKNVELHLVD